LNDEPDFKLVLKRESHLTRRKEDFAEGIHQKTSGSTSLTVGWEGNGGLLQNVNGLPNPSFIVKHNYYLIFSVGHMDRLSGQW
jgi:hypothetical protein